jgi:K+-sensing histidine kinase KdpD
LKSLIKYKLKILASLSHELKTPLNCSLNMLKIMKNKVSKEINENYLEPALISD